MTTIAPSPVKAPVQTPAKVPGFDKFMDNVLKPINEEKNKTPEMHAVILHNDPTTPVEIVTIILRTVFGIPKDRAWSIMLAAHNSTSAVVCILPKDEAEKKVAQANAEGRAADTVLTFTSELESK